MGQVAVVSIPRRYRKTLLSHIFLRIEFPTTTDLRDAIELLLRSEVEEGESKRSRKDAGHLLQQGLNALAGAPHRALGINVGAKTHVI